MIHVWTEPTSITKEFRGTMEDCIFCGKGTRTWHEDTNNPICVNCANKHDISEIKEDHGELIRKKKREGTFDREDSVRAN